MNNKAVGVSVEIPFWVGSEVRQESAVQLIPIDIRSLLFNEVTRRSKRKARIMSAIERDPLGTRTMQMAVLQVDKEKGEIGMEEYNVISKNLGHVN